MRKVILASHGNLAEGLRNSVKMIIDDNHLDLSCYCLLPGNSLDDLFANVKKEIEKYNEDTIIILTDLFGGSVCNILSKLVTMDNVYVISGMNLCMVLTICLGDQSIDCNELIEQAINDSKKNIINLKNLWERKEEILYD